MRKILFLLRAALMVLAMFAVASRVQAQSSEQLLAQLQDLQGKMAQASDPCPFMPQFKQLINQMASSIPDIYNAMKPALDAMNQENDGCSSGGSSNSSGEGVPAPVPSTVPAPNPPQAEEQRKSNADAPAQYEQPKAANAPATCPASGLYAPAGAQAVRCRPGQTMSAAQPAQHAGTGTAAPAACVDTGHGCVPVDQYNAIQAERERLKQTAQLCSKSGMLTGQGTQNGDVAVMTPIPCTPGDYYLVRGKTATNINDVPIHLRVTPAPVVAKSKVTGSSKGGQSGGASQTASAAGAAKSGPGAGCYVVMHPGEAPVPIDCCRDMTMMVQVDTHWTDATKTEVVAFMTNNSMSDLTCSTAFLETGGVWGEFGTGSLKFGATRQGGQSSGLWSMSAIAPVLGYKCFEGKDPMMSNGQFCNSNITYPPYAPGTSAR